MPINTSFYGEESTWIKYGDFPYTTYISNPSNTAYMERTRGSLSDLFRMGRLDLNEYPDLSVCYAGMSNTADVLNCRYTNYEKNEVSQKAPSSVPFFFAAGAVLNPTATGGCIQPEADYTTWGMGTTTSTIKHEAIENGDAGIIPIVSLGGRSIVLVINVTAVQPSGDSGFDGNVVNTTLDDWYANYKDTHTRIVRIYATAYVITSNSSRSMYQAPTSWSTSVNRGTLIAVPCDPITAYGRSMMGLTKLDCNIFRNNKGFVISGSAGTVLNAAVPYANFSDNYIYPVFGKRWHIVNSSSDGRLEAWAFLDISELGGADGFMEYARKQASYFGLFFTGSSDLARRVDDAMFEDENMYLGIIDSDSITRGRYTHGTANKEQPQYNTKDLIKNSKYDPEKPVPPTPSEDPVLPQRPGFTLADGHGSVTYCLQSTEFNQIWDDIYNRSKSSWKDLIEGLQLFGANPLNAILSYRWFPFKLSGTSQRPVVLGRTSINPQHIYPTIEYASAFYKQDGIFNYNHDKNFINSKHCKCRLWLPFYGFVELPMTQVLSKELEITFQYNAPDDIGVWIVSFGNVVYDYYECVPYIDIPITGDNGMQIALAKQQSAINTALTIGGAVLAVGLTAVSAGVNIAGAAATAGISAGEYVSQALTNTGAALTGRAMLYGGAEAAQQIGLVGRTAGAVAAAGAGAGIGIVNNITNTANQIGTLSTNVPVKAGAAATTFLHLPMKPFIQFYTNTLMETANIPEYKKTVGIACEKWGTINSMPENSLLSISNPTFNTSGMNKNEVNMLINALNSFYK